MQQVSRRILSYVLVGAACLVVGFFTGREYLKYEIRSALQAVATGMQGTTAAGRGNQTAPDAERPAAHPERSTEAQLLSVSLIHKGFVPRDIENEIFEDKITFTLLFKNLGNNDIRAFDGVLTFSDLLDNTILSSRLAITDPVKAGATMTWAGEMDYNEFEAAKQRLRTEGMQNLKVSFIPQKILFVDGSSKEFN